MYLKTMSFVPLLLAPLMPLAVPTIAAAQRTAQARSAVQIPVVTQSDETLYFNPDTTYSLPLVVESAVNINGRNLPAGTVIQGRLEPVEGGLRYVATGIEAGGLTEPRAATSVVLTDIKDPRESSAGSIAGDAAIGAAGGAVIGAVLGDGISLLEILGGAATGVVVGNVTAQRVVILEPNEPVILQTQ